MPLHPSDGPMSQAEIDIAKEKGRLKAYEVLVSNPVKRAQMEKKWGLAAMQRRWPELYALKTPTPISLWKRFLSRTFGAYGSA